MKINNDASLAPTLAHNEERHSPAETLHAPEPAPAGALPAKLPTDTRARVRQLDTGITGDPASSKLPANGNTQWKSLRGKLSSSALSSKTGHAQAPAEQAKAAVDFIKSFNGKLD